MFFSWGLSGDGQCEDIHLNMICKCQFLACKCFRQTWKLLIIILTANHRDFGGFNAYKTNEQQVFRLVFLIAKSAPQTLRDQKKMTSFDKVIPNNFAEAETKDLSQFTIKNKPHLKYKCIYIYIYVFFCKENFHIFPTSTKKNILQSLFSPTNILGIQDTPATVWITSSPFLGRKVGKSFTNQPLHFKKKRSLNNRFSFGSPQVVSISRQKIIIIHFYIFIYYFMMDFLFLSHFPRCWFIYLSISSRFLFVTGWLPQGTPSLRQKLDPEC